MGAIGGLLGVNGGAGGTGFDGPRQADQTGMNNLQDSYSRLLQVAQGQGPNPAQAQYQQNIQNLARQQSGAISSIQGISPALAARMASQQGSAAMQNAAGQGATMQAQQQLGAMGQMGQVAGMQANAANQMQGNINNVNMGFGTTAMQGQQGVIGGLFGGLGAAAAAGGGGGGGGGAAAGGVAGIDFSAPVPQQNGADAFQFGQPTQSGGPQSAAGKFMADIPAASGPGAIQAGMTQFGGGMGTLMRGHPAPQNAGQGPTMANAAASGGGIPYAAPTSYANGGMSSDYRSGGNVVAKSASQKAIRPGNSPANDKIKAVLSEGEVVIPRDVMQSVDPIRASADFVARVIAKRRGMAR